MTAPTANKTAGRVVRVTGPVVDVEFPRDAVPPLFSALNAEITYEAMAKTLTLEVAQHLGDNLVRTISMQPTDGLVRGVDVVSTGNTIAVPVGDGVKGHVFNALGNCLTSRATAVTSRSGRSTASRRPSISSSRVPRCWRPV